MKTIIVDDEPRAIELLRNYLSHFSDFKLCATFRNGLKALEYLSKEGADLVFLDINMPHISGISLARMIPKDTLVVFTTAYSEYAVESYEVSAIDYLLKPISMERFSKTMGKILESASLASGGAADEVILVKSGHEKHRIRTDEIQYLEKDGNYVTYYLSHRKILARATAEETLHLLPDYFSRAHKSFIVNTRKVLSWDKDELQLEGARIPIGASYRRALLEKLKVG
ncbi:LytR/AlgR family response regulator transcription factor [Zeaxanthinibacter enoshimensis]|uniref:DNA-binding LytR/AlgR family response regulator n=1 Tax=Zeaxanthinibacter enoshimensis TaxID=392009 RepID=A0A4R6TPR8_9FLAO|nr:response regulator transcription factor [Zeaxanthinibacter enoshimensis]TDQ33140.1 DNA-binding LytR/AlgR family response regulator [Zeaxanthinibacter enoshimensis]